MHLNKANNYVKASIGTIEIKYHLFLKDIDILKKTKLSHEFKCICLILQHNPYP